MLRGNPGLENSQNTSPIPLRLTNGQLKFGGLVRDPPHVEARKLVLKTARIGLPSLPQEVSGLCLEETQTKSIDRTLVVSSELPEQTHGVALSTDVAVARLGKANSERVLRVRDTGK
jgi:hypothetical protein